MSAVEFHTTINEGTSEVSEVYRHRFKGRARVILVAEEDRTTGNLIDQLLQAPLQSGWIQAMHQRRAV
jgi:hypothetical protein